MNFFSKLTFQNSPSVYISGRKIYVIGGSSHGHSAGVGTAEFFDVDSQEWSESFSLPSGTVIVLV